MKKNATTFKFRIFLLFLLTYSSVSFSQDSVFYGKMSKPQLESYLSKSIVTEFDQLSSGTKPYNDLIDFAVKLDARMLTTCFGVGYGSELPFKYGGFDSIMVTVQNIKTAYKNSDHEPPILGAAIWEAVTRDVDSLMPDSNAASMYNVPIRHFIFDSMKYANDTNTRIATPDITRRETQLYFYYIATRLIDCGIENLQMGIIGIENLNDNGNIITWDLYGKIRQSAASKNRGLVLISAGTNGLYLKQTDTLIFDFCAIPSRVSGYYTGTDSTWASMWDYFESPYGGPGKLSYNDCSPYGKVLGGQTYMGWYSDSMPYMVDLDNYLTNLCNCLSSGCWNAYGYDEISWFSLQTEEYRNQWLCYANTRVKELDRNCYFTMPVRTLFTRVWKYYNAINGYGYNQEDAIVNIWNDNMTGCEPNDVTDVKSIWGTNTNGINIMVYPNPANGTTNICYSAPKTAGPVSIRVIDVLGNTVAHWQSSHDLGNVVWHTDDVRAGIYTCIATTASQPAVTFKVTVLK